MCIYIFSRHSFPTLLHVHTSENMLYTSSISIVLYIYWSHKTVGKSASQLFSVTSYLFLFIELSHYCIFSYAFFFPLCDPGNLWTLQRFSLVHRIYITHFVTHFMFLKIFANSVKIVHRSRDQFHHVSVRNRLSYNLPHDF